MTGVERSAVQYGLTRIEYAVRRSARRRTVSIAVEPELGVVLTAPEGTAIARLDGVVRTKAQWIVARMRAERAREPRPAAREFVSGESFLYLGRQYRLRVVSGGAKGARMERGMLVVRVGARGGAVRAREVRQRLVEWYRARAEERLPERVAHWAQRLGVAPRAVVLTDPRRRWGSCGPDGTLRLSWRVVQAPVALVDYVVAHEVAHLRHADHGPAFWRLLGRAISDYDARRTALRMLGPRMEW